MADLVGGVPGGILGELLVDVDAIRLGVADAGHGRRSRRREERIRRRRRRPGEVVVVGGGAAGPFQVGRWAPRRSL